MNDVASYKAPTTLETDKKINLIYGLNGTGKSVLSNYLYEKENTGFSSCNIEGLNNEDILVYNQKFIQDYFYEPDNLKGIFTLSKENKEAEKKIKNAQKEIDDLETVKQGKGTKKEEFENELKKKKENAENITWDIKTEYTGGDRVLEFCLENLKGKEETLFNHISVLKKPQTNPNKTTEQLKKEVEAIQGDTAKKYDLLPQIIFPAQDEEENQI